MLKQALYFLKSLAAQLRFRRQTAANVRTWFKPLIQFSGWKVFTLERIAILALIIINITILYTFTKRTKYLTKQLEQIQASREILEEKQNVPPVMQHKESRPSQSVEALSFNIQRGNRSYPMIALTYDGGSNDNYACQILDILREKKVKSTIFLTGRFIQKYPDIVRRIAADGHEVGNHTFSHSHLTTYEQNFLHETTPDVTQESFRDELAAADSLFREVTGAGMTKYWRAPFGEHNKQLRRWAAEEGYRHVSWTKSQTRGESMDTHDWVNDAASKLYKSAQEIRDVLLHFGSNDAHRANGAIILMHLGTNREGDYLYETLPEIIDGFRDQGYKLCTISELLSNDR